MWWLGFQWQVISVPCNHQVRTFLFRKRGRFKQIALQNTNQNGKIKFLFIFVQTWPPAHKQYFSVQKHPFATKLTALNFTNNQKYFLRWSNHRHLFCHLSSTCYHGNSRHLQWRSKWGRALSSNPLGTRLPLIACCPTHAIICDMLIKEPLEPHTAIVRGLLEGCNS